MKHFVSLSLVFLLSAHAAPPDPATCAAIQAPAPCGQPNDGPELCGLKGCCWDASQGSNACFYPGGNAVTIKHVHVIQSCHFDAGYADSTVGIMNLWFHTHFPQVPLVFCGGLQSLRVPMMRSLCVLPAGLPSWPRTRGPVKVRPPLHGSVVDRQHVSRCVGGLSDMACRQHLCCTAGVVVGFLLPFAPL
jgi:hypothetical protein